MTSSRAALVEVDDGRVAGRVHAGDPVDGCRAVELVVVAASRMEIVKRARATGVSHPAFWPVEAPGAETVQAALSDPGGFVWRYWDEETWRPSSEL
jgi:hypothetical protein